MTNIGRFGYQIKFVDSRVEGMMSVKDLTRAVRFFKKNPVDVLVIIRGGGSLESLQAFNNESLIREVASLEMPVICGIGHDKDVPLLSYVADRAVSTPSIVAKEINSSWEHAVDKLDHFESNILNSYGTLIREAKFLLDSSSLQLKQFYQKIFARFEYCQQNLRNIFSTISFVLKKDREKLDKVPKLLTASFVRMMQGAVRLVDGYQQALAQNNPERQLRLGYSILMLNGKVLKSVKEIRKGDLLVSNMGDGALESQITRIFEH
jgi:exodeoxyribonuclease VII large subunit